LAAAAENVSQALSPVQGLPTLLGHLALCGDGGQRIVWYNFYRWINLRVVTESNKHTEESYLKK
jgi:hypothetical protein